MSRQMIKTSTIPFNKPYFSGKEYTYIQEAISYGKISGDGLFTKKCHQFFCDRFHFNKVLLTTSCTAALEMSALLVSIKPGDEVIMPSYTFPSTANAFVLRGAKIIFADSETSNPNIDVSKVEALITKNTKAIVPVHYAGVACDMDPLMQIAKEHNLYIIEDAAQATQSFYKGKPLGTLGHLAAFSFHETKNISSGEGGMLAINDPLFEKRSEIIWEKGTNRSAFFRGEVDKYGWVDIGSSFLPSDVIAALLYAQLENLDEIQEKRLQIWQHYYEGLKPLAEKEFFSLPHIPDYTTNNAHMFYLTCRSEKERSDLMQFLKKQGVCAIFHYQPLHKSDYYKNKHDGRALLNTEHFSNCLVRLPLYYDLTFDDVSYIVENIGHFFNE